MPVLVYYGEEDYLLEQAVLDVREKTVNPAMASLTHRVLKQPSLAAVLEAAGSVSLALGGNTLIEVRDFPFLHQASKDSATDAQLEELKSLLEQMAPTKTFLWVSAKLDSRLKFPKWLTKNPQFHIQKFEPLSFWQVDKAAQFVLQYAKTRGYVIQPDAAEYLAQSVGCDLRQLSNEVEKLTLFIPDRPIAMADVKAMTPQSDNLFTLARRWILQEAAPQNYADLGEILLNKHPVEIFALLQTYFNNIFRVLYLNRTGASASEIAQRTAQKPFTIQKHLQDYSRVSLDRLKTLKKLLVELEWKTKTGQLQGPLALEILLGS